jgi:hypothetical protein
MVEKPRRVRPGVFRTYRELQAGSAANKGPHPVRDWFCQIGMPLIATFPNRLFGPLERRISTYAIWHACKHASQHCSNQSIFEMPCAAIMRRLLLHKRGSRASSVACRKTSGLSATSRRGPMLPRHVATGEWQVANGEIRIGSRQPQSSSNDAEGSCRGGPVAVQHSERSCRRSAFGNHP